MAESVDFAKVKQAKAAGHSEADILKFLGQKNPELSKKIDTALSSGHSATDVLNHISPEPSNLRSLLSAPVKGIAKALGKFGSFAAPLVLEDEPLEERIKILEAGKKEREKFEQGTLENLLPTKERFAEKALERGGEMLPTSLIGGGGVLQGGIRALLAGFAGEGIKEAGGGPLAQTIGEVATLGAPKLGKNILPTKSQKSIVDFARQHGLSEHEIAPLIQSPKKLSFFSKMAKKGGKTEDALQKSLDARKRIYSQLEASPAAQSSISNQIASDFLSETGTLVQKLPANLRQKAFQDYMDLAKKIKTGDAKVSDFMNLWGDLNYEISQGSKGLGILKDPIEKVFKKASPGFSEDFELTRDLYKRFYPVAKKLKSSVSEELLDAGELGGLLYGVAKGKLGLLTEILGVESARRLSREMLINPRLQNLHLQMVNALNANKFSVAKEIADKMIDSTSPDKSKQPTEKQKNQSKTQ